LILEGLNWGLYSASYYLQAVERALLSWILDLFTEKSKLKSQEDPKLQSKVKRIQSKVKRSKNYIKRTGS